MKSALKMKFNRPARAEIVEGRDSAHRLSNLRRIYTHGSRTVECARRSVHAGTTMTRRVFVGGIVTSKSISELQVIEHGILGVDANGVIAFVEDLEKLATDAAAYLKTHGWEQGTEVVQLEDGSFVCPGFIDTHTVRASPS